MKKIYSLIKACMTSDMSLFKIKINSNKKTSFLIPLFIAFYLMFMIWSSANSMFEKLSPMNLSHIMLSLFSFGISVMTFFEGIYKSGPLIFNCKDDGLLLSLPIKRRVVLFIRIFKFYVFELLYNSMFLLPIMIAYIRWASDINWIYFLTSIIMLLMLPIIPIVLSCVIGVITSNISSKFKYKNVVQILISMIFLIVMLALSFNMNSVFNYITKHSTNISNIISKVYYPSGAYIKLVTNFNISDLLVFIFINVSIFALTIYILGKFYFKINSRLKNVETTSKKIKIDDLVIERKSKIKSIVDKELGTFFKTPVFIINAGFALVLFLIAIFIIIFKFKVVIPILCDENNGLGLKKELVMNNLSIVIFVLVSITAYMTSITNSVISLEGKNINILKSLPIKAKTILLGKVLAALTITTPILLIGDFALFIMFKVKIVEALLLIFLSILITLVSHFIGIIINLKYPKLKWESSTEVVKQSTSSLLSVMIGMVLLFISVTIVMNLIGKVNATLLLCIATIIYVIIDICLYRYLINKGTIDFNNLSI